MLELLQGFQWGTAFIALEIPVHSMLELQSLGRADMMTIELIPWSPTLRRSSEW